jgi:hypothetical protein
MLSRRVWTLLLLSLCLAPALLAQGVPFQIQVQSGSSSFLVLNNATLNFSVDAIGKTSSLTMVLTYEGSSSVVVGQPQIFGQNSFAITGAPTFPDTLNPGDTLTLSIQFTASAVTQATGQISIPYTEKGATSSTSGTLGFTLSGTVPSMVITYALPTNGNVITVDNGSTIGFPSEVVGSSISVPIAIINRGSGTGLIQSVAITGTDPTFTLQQTPLTPLSLASGSNVQFDVQYTPNQTGTNTSILTIQFSDRTVMLGLQGTGIASLLSYQLVQGTQTTALTPGQSISFPDTNVGSKSSVTVLAQNTSSTTISNIGAAVTPGPEYSITDEPINPITLNVNQTASFTITFAPTQAGPAPGKLRIGNDSFNLSATAIGAQLVYSYSTGSASTTVAPGGAVLFSPATVGQTESTTFTVQNNGTTAATITSIGISSSQTVFTLPSQPSLPLSLDPGQSTQFSVAFTPTITGLATATLLVNDQQFPLSGFGNAPSAISAYQFTGASGNQTPATQAAIGLSLASGYPLDISGKLTIAVNTGTLPADASVQFSSGGQTVNFTIPANTTQAVFTGGSTQIGLQTGTVAGTITVTPSFTLASGLDVTPASPTPLTLTIPAGVLQLTNALISQATQNSVTLQIFGYTTDRILSAVQFQFTTESSATLPSISVPVQSYAQAWFSTTASQSFGGQFLVTVPFNLSTTSSSTTSLMSLLKSVSITASGNSVTSNAVTVAITQ